MKANERVIQPSGAKLDQGDWSVWFNVLLLIVVCIGAAWVTTSKKTDDSRRAEVRRIR
jgi:hypothetical protein